MAGIWSNPEFVRQRRAELRPARAMTAAAVVVLTCILLGLACWSSQQNQLLNLQRAAEEYGTQAWTQRLDVFQQNFARNTWLLFFAGWLDCRA